MTPIQLFDPATCTYSYVLFDEETREALIIDPVVEQLQRDLGILEESHLKLLWIVETHLHEDHVTGAARLAQATGAHVAAPAASGVQGADRQLADGDTLPFGRETLRTLATPGHSVGSVCYLIEPRETPGAWHVFTGDTLLVGDCGRTDLPGSDAGALYDSITRKLFVLAPDAVVWPGHDYHEHAESTLALERATNPRLVGKTRTAFVAAMAAAEWPVLADMAQTLAANRQKGEPKPSDKESDNVTPEKAAAQATAAALEVTPAAGYAGDVSPQTAHAWVQAGRAVLVDVRSDAERAWVGFVPEAQVVAWKQWPGMVMNAAFDAEIKAAAQDGKPLLMLCQLGGRATQAAKRATELGLTAYNVSGGFEGEADANGQRGHRTGWRAAGLPWRQK